jgi:archaellum component FlaG (FlaF/FlaG flagellin family)
MAESVITVSIITIACVICATMLVSAIYPAVNRATSSVVSSSAKLGDRIETSVDIIAEANESSYEYVWVNLLMPPFWPLQAGIILLKTMMETIDGMLEKPST